MELSKYMTSQSVELRRSACTWLDINVDLKDGSMFLIVLFFCKRQLS